MVMIEKPGYIKNFETKNNDFLSTIEISFTDRKLEKFLDSRNFTTMWSRSSSDPMEYKIEVHEKIYKTKQGFFLYLFLGSDTSVLTIYYKQEQHNELLIFIPLLLKQYKNDTINK